MTQADGKPSRAPATDGMAGQGFYDGHSREQAKVIRSEAERLRYVVEQLDLSVPELRIVDYGCGPGRNSMTAFHTVLDAVHDRRADVPVVAVHNDQISNDWNGLFANVGGPRGYLHSHPSVRVEASIASFYDSVESAGTVDLGMSFVAAHWLSSAIRLSSPDTLFFADLIGAARDEIAALADQDWTSFLRHRAREIKPGGWLVVHVFSSVSDHGDPSGLRAAGRYLFRAFWRIAIGMADSGLIDRDLLDTFIFPVYFREEHEVRAPLEREPDLVQAFEIVELSNELIPSPALEELDRTGDIDAYAVSYAEHCRAFTESAFRKGLFDVMAADTAEADWLTDQFYRRAETLFRDEPRVHDSELQSMTLVLKRR